MATILFATPHQDDETLSMGSAIRKHIEAGVHDVHVLLLTAGSGSAAQPKTGLDDAAFSATRDDEYERACRTLGVEYANIHFATPRPVGDTVLTVLEAEIAIEAFAEAYPGVWVKTYTNRAAPNRHVDHIAAGQAAVNLLALGVLAPNTVRLYVEPWLVAGFRTANPSVVLSSERAATVGWVQRAYDEYGYVDHVGGKYGIGHLSVDYFSARPDPVNYYHVP